MQRWRAPPPSAPPPDYNGRRSWFQQHEADGGVGAASGVCMEVEAEPESGVQPLIVVEATAVEEVRSRPSSRARRRGPGGAGRGRDRWRHLPGLELSVTSRDCRSLGRERVVHSRAHSNDRLSCSKMAMAQVAPRCTRASRRTSRTLCYLDEQTVIYPSVQHRHLQHGAEGRAHSPAASENT